MHTVVMKYIYLFFFSFSFFPIFLLLLLFFIPLVAGYSLLNICFCSFCTLQHRQVKLYHIKRGQCRQKLLILTFRYLFIIRLLDFFLSFNFLKLENGQRYFASLFFLWAYRFLLLEIFPLFFILPNGKFPYTRKRYWLDKILKSGAQIFSAFFEKRYLQTQYRSEPRSRF